MSRQPKPCMGTIIVLVIFATAECAGGPQPTAPPGSGVLAGMGTVHHRIATSTQEAQKFFEQGPALVYGFNFAEAVRSFRRASELDPKSPMPYWGIVLANGPNYNAWSPTPARRAASRDAIGAALGLSTAAPAAEQAYVQALAHCFLGPGAAVSASSRRNCADAMREVHRAYPDDPDAAVLFAASLMDVNPWHLWTVDGSAGPDTEEIVATLEDALHRWPDHLGANHFYIHAMESSPYPERALPSARILETLAPEAGHLVHMPSHIYLRTGDYAKAVECNQRAVAADDAYLASRPNEQAAGMGYSHHNLAFLAVSAAMDGQYRAALDAARRLQDHAHSGAFVVMPMIVLLRFARWDELTALPEPHSGMEGVKYFWRYARGFAYASRGMVKEAYRERQAMEGEYGGLAPGRAFATFFNDWSATHRIGLDVLDARIASAAGDVSDSIRLWQNAVALEDRLNFDDLPDWYYPVRESLGAALLRNGQAHEAEKVFREDLRRNPLNPRSLFGLCQCLRAQKKNREASSAGRAFELAWRGERPPRIEDY